MDGTNATRRNSSQGGKSAVIGVIVAVVIMFLLIVAVVATAVGLVISRKQIERTISRHGMIDIIINVVSHTWKGLWSKSYHMHN